MFPTICAQRIRLVGSALAVIALCASTAVLAADNPPSNIKYPRTTISATMGKAIAADTPTVSGTVSSWKVSPALPIGLKFSASTGEISGTPTTFSYAASYTITAKSAAGSTTSKLSISVTGAHKVLLELGHVNPITGLQFVSGRVVSVDFSGHWNIWSYATGKIRASGDNVQAHALYRPYDSNYFVPPIVATGETVVLPIPNALELRNVSTGALIAHIDVPNLNTNPPSGSSYYSPWWQSAPDGSYIVIGSSTGLDFYSPAGDKTRSVAGDFSVALALALPGKVLIAIGPKGRNVIQSVSATTGASTVSPKFVGTFYSWFADGSHFFANSGTTFYTYSNTAALKALVTVPINTNIAGTGNWYWKITTATDALSLYKIGSSTPSYTYSGGAGSAVLSGTTLGLLANNAFCSNPADLGCTSQGDRLVNVTLIDLSGSSPAASQYFEPTTTNHAFAIDSTGDWILGNDSGVLLDASSNLPEGSRYLSLGSVSSIAGSAPTVASASNRVAIATAMGQIFFYNPNPVAPVYEGAQGSPATVLQMSGNGTVLSVGIAGGSTVVESLPSGKTLGAFNASNFTLSASGTIVGTVASNGSATVTGVSGKPVIWSSDADSNNLSPILISPDGTLIAQFDGVEGPEGTTTVWKNGALLSAIPGQGIDWIDNNRLLLAEFEHVVTGGWTYANSTVYSAAGQLLVTLPWLPQLTTIQPIAGNSVYAPETNVIYRLTAKGGGIWSGALPGSGIGSVSGHQIVYASGHTVVTETY